MKGVTHGPCMGQTNKIGSVQILLSHGNVIAQLEGHESMRKYSSQIFRWLVHFGCIKMQ